MAINKGEERVGEEKAETVQTIEDTLDPASKEFADIRKQMIAAAKQIIQVQDHDGKPDRHFHFKLNDGSQFQCQMDLAQLAPAAVDEQLKKIPRDANGNLIVQFELRGAQNATYPELTEATITAAESIINGAINGKLGSCKEISR